MRRSRTTMNDQFMAKAMGMFACSMAATASILIVSALSLLLGPLLVVVILVSVLVLRSDQMLPERNR